MSDFVDDWLDQSFNNYLSSEGSVDTNNTISDIVKVYPNMLQIIIYHKDYQLPKKSSNSNNSTIKKIQSQAQKERNLHRSVRRSRQTVKDIIESNNWDYWCTFTFKQTKNLDRYNMHECRRKFSLWLDRQKGLSYIAVPEHHKDGAIHFHALLKNYNGTLKDTGKTTKYGAKIFKGNFRGGINQFIPLDDNKQAIARYMTKQYITKDMAKVQNFRRYLCSKDVIRPLKLKNKAKSLDLITQVSGRTPDFINQSYELHHLPITPALKLKLDKNQGSIFDAFPSRSSR